MEYLIIGEGRRRRVYLSHFGADGSARFKAGPPGRAHALRFPDRTMAEAAADRARTHDIYDFDWHAAPA